MGLYEQLNDLELSIQQITPPLDSQDNLRIGYLPSDSPTPFD